MPAPQSYHLLYETTPLHTRAALFNPSGNLCMLRHHEPTRPLVQGSVINGKVRKVVPSLGSVFVDIGDTYDAIVPLRTLPNGLQVTGGQSLLVRITRGGFAEKGAQADARVAHPAPTSGPCPHLVKSAPNPLILALHDAGSNPVTVWLTDPRARAEVAKIVPDKHIRQLDPAGDGAEWLDKLDAALAAILNLRPTFAIPGGTAVVELTSAVATIDLNFGGGGPLAGLAKPQAVQAFNLSAAEDVARLVRLLDLGGMVIIDFVTPKTRAQREAITTQLVHHCTQHDEHFMECRPMSRHGLQELARSRTGPSLQLLLATPEYVAGAAVLAMARTLPGQWRGAVTGSRSQVLTAHPGVIAHLQPRLTPEFCLTYLGRPVQLVPNPAYGPTAYTLSG